MRITLAKAAVIGLFLQGTPPASMAQPVAPDVSDLEFKCMANASKAAAKLVVSRMKCTSKCVANIWKGLVAEDPATCFDRPFNNAFMTSCVGNVESKFVYAFRKKCDQGTTPAVDCPECYAGGDCATDSTTRMSQVSDLIGGFGPSVFCERTGAFLLEMRCETTAAKVIPKYVVKLDKCYDKCFALARRGIVTVGSCGPPATDPVVQACLATARQDAIDAIDHDCHPPPGSPDGCGGPYPDGAGWADQVEAAFVPDVPVTYCASPSGAFLDRPVEF